MSGDLFVQGSCASPCGPLVLRLLCPTASSSSYRLVMPERMLFTRPADLFFIGGIKICFDNPLFMDCDHVVNMNALYGADVPEYLVGHAEYVTQLLTAGNNLDMIISDLDSQGYPTGEIVTVPGGDLVFGATINEYAYCATFSRETPSGSTCINLSSFTGCKFTVSFGSDYPLTTASGVTFCAPPRACATTCGSVVTQAEDLVPIAYSQGNTINLSGLISQDTPAAMFITSPTSGDLAYTAMSMIGNIPLNGDDFYNIVTPVFVSGTWNSNDPAQPSGFVTSFSVVTASDGTVYISLDNDGPIQAGSEVQVILNVRLEEVGCSRNVSALTQQYIINSTITS